MKAERRHELKTNTLAQGLGGFPVFWAQYGTKVLLAVVAVLAIFLFIRVQRNAAITQREQAGQAYSEAVSGLSGLQMLPMAVRDPRMVGEQARVLQTQVETAISQVLDMSDDDALKAEALVARGDLNWHMARLPGLHGTTQPATTRSSIGGSAANSSSEVEDLLDKARRAYDAAAKAPGAKPITIATAKLGLAAIAEQRRQWDEARKTYEELRDNAGTPQPFKDHAKVRLEDLQQIQKPVLIGRPATEPASNLPDVEQPSATAPVGPPAPTTTPTTSPAPTTKP